MSGASAPAAGYMFASRLNASFTVGCSLVCEGGQTGPACTSERSRREALRVLHPQLAGDELGQQRVAQAGERAGFVGACQHTLKDRLDAAFECLQHMRGREDN